jgi:hypothetical protein
MAKVSLDEIKSKFETGDRPNGADFIDLIDTLAAQATDLGSSGNNEHEITGIELPTVIESLPISEWRIVKYLVSISKTSDGNNKFYATELSILIDQTDLSVSEYGIIDNDGDIGTVSVSRIGDNLRLIVTPNPAIVPVTVRFVRIGLKA